ncbi:MULTISPECIES: RagB/SusD family nutrient uptake outer membrane protein [Butyricimonas]|uniref:RagB/SusD family nutrient uptake outer membrane protein n=1 Tax=Butyricimonas TaxID=574697 RepID=UPI001D05ECDD|nr:MULTISPECIES: RagB/SusD family nutrient uptake outer membrane protein [Butyricimonas]MCB6974846.1 RagB/SusD family nutrient uptake outer membrane protein [Butyricimonas synergistica]MCG4521588.1 RagB/SusD family nutrient uptake outer membrane protein [Butyricimonas sp. DFI.6.44]
MKKRYFIGLLVGFLVLHCGCSDWLDVNPRTEMKEEDMYQSEKGFKNVMNGIYIQMASKELYGKNTTYYFPDLLAGYWYKTNNTTENYIMSYFYSNKDVEKVIKTIWSKYYTVIAHINDLIENLDKTDVNFTYGNKELLYGEAYGLRAFLHLDILRLFGPVPADASDGIVAIPYVTELTRDPSKLVSVTYGEVKKMILEDLDKAEGYLANDPFKSGSMYDLNNPNGNGVKYKPNDDWHYYRQTHFNTYAVDATRARFYQWIGDKTQAEKCAKKVIEMRNTDETDKFTLATNSTYSDSGKGALVMACEHIFAVNCSDLQNIINGVLITSSSSSTPELFLENNWISKVYENPESDNRSKGGRYFQTNGSRAYYLKYYESSSIAATDMIPLIRLAEMYLILIENSILTDAQGYFEIFRQARGMDFTISIGDETKRENQVEKEYRKDFWGEGQMFYYYKRWNKTSWSLPQSVTIPANGFVIPKPQGQTAFE